MTRRERPTLGSIVTAATMLVVGLATSSCSGSGPNAARSSTTAAPRAITQAEAGRLADVLVTNHTLGGADVRAHVTFGVASFDLSGMIDWTNHAGRVTVHSDVKGVTPSPDFDIVFDPRLKFEQVPGLADALGAQSRPRANWVAAALDAKASPLNQVLALVDSASSIQRDNPVLLVSNGTRYLRRDSVSGVDVDVFDYGRTRYWVGRSDNRLYRIEADLQSTRSTATVDFTAHGPRKITTPDAADVVALDTVSDLYHQLRGG